MPEQGDRIPPCSQRRDSLRRLCFDQAGWLPLCSRPRLWSRWSEALRLPPRAQLPVSELRCKTLRGFYPGGTDPKERCDAAGCQKRSSGCAYHRLVPLDLRTMLGKRMTVIKAKLQRILASRGIKSESTPVCARGRPMICLTLSSS